MVKPEVIFLTIPPVGHVKPSIELAKLLLSSSSSLSITILTIPSFFPSCDATTAPHISSVAAAVADICFESLPSVPTSLREGESPDAYFARFIHHHNPHVRAALFRRLAAKTQPIAALILDVFCWPAIDIARDLGLRAYFYVTWNAAMLSYMLHLPSCTISHFGPGEIIHVPGMGPVPAAYVPGFVIAEEDRKLFSENGKRFREARGLILNTFEELEPAVMDAIISVAWRRVRCRRCSRWDWCLPWMRQEEVKGGSVWSGWMSSWTARWCLSVWGVWDVLTPNEPRRSVWSFFFFV